MPSTQFRSDDTTLWWLKYGNGSDGAYSSAGNATDAPVDSSCSGTVDTTSLSATNASFANGKPILIHQSRGTGAGSWELNQIASYTAGTITTVSPLKNTYTDSGASQAQVIQLKQYSSFTQNSGHTLTAKAWDGNVGGIIAFLCNGTTTVDGTITATGKGFNGGASPGWSGTDRYSYQGEGASGTGGLSNLANVGGGGGGWGNSGSSNGGGGGGHGAAGTTGQAAGETPGTGGTADGNASLTDMVFGGGGGCGGQSDEGNNPGAGGIGGGTVFIISKNIILSGVIASDGNNGGNASGGVVDGGGGGGGAGGAVLIKCQTGTLGTNKITASAGSGGISTGPGGDGGAGGVGRIHLDYLTSYTGTTTPTIDVTQDYSLADKKSSMLLNFL